LAAGLALSEMFSYLMRLHAEAGRRSIGLSLWTLDARQDWRMAERGPNISYLPSDLAVIGLGHLGQGYLWGLSALPYARPRDLAATLQDDDPVGTENISTGLLVTPSDVGRFKTRVAAEWFERRGFRTRIIERRFRPGDQIAETDPALILAGLDSPDSRADLARALSKSPLASAQLIDVGLGPSVADFDDLVLHSLPPTARDIDRWTAAAHRVTDRTARLANSQRFRDIAAANALDACGTVQLAQLAVAVPYVGASVGAIVVAEILRRLAGAPAVRSLSLQLRDPSFASPPTFHDRRLLSPAFADAR